MKFHSIQLEEGSAVTNMTLASGTSFPGNPTEGELFYRSDVDPSVKGMYVYIQGLWSRIASADAITVPSGVSFPSAANPGDLFYINTNDSSKGLYVYSGDAWGLVADGGGGSVATVTGDVTGTLTTGSSGALTLATVSTAGTSGSASKTVTVTIDAKGRVTSLSDQDIAIAASQVTSGTFADARISETSVTQHQGSIDIDASQVTSGTFSNARVAQSNITQHQAALTILESQITDGSLLARNAGNETITGTWTFNNAVTGATPTAGAHLATKDYVDNLATGLDFKASVRAATTANITLSGTQTVDGVALVAGNRVLVKDQTDNTTNGIYVVASGAWTRATDADNTPSNEVSSGMYCFVESGTTNADTGWVLTTDGGNVTLGTTALVFTQFTGLGQITAGTGLSKTGSTLSIANTGTAGTYTAVTTNAQGQVTSGANLTATGDVTGTASGTSIALSLPSVGTPVTSSFVKITTDAKGRVSGTTAVTTADITGLVDATYVNVAGDTMTGTLNLPSNGLVVGTNQLVVSGGNVGIGTTGAQRGLHLAGGAGSSLPSIRFERTSVRTFSLETSNTGKFILLDNTAGADRLTVDNSGNVGIGISNPSARFQVLNGDNSNGAIRLSATGTTTGKFASMTYITGTASWNVGTEAGNGRFFINSQGVSDQLVFTGGSNSTAAINALGTGAIRLNTAGNNRVLITDTGTVAINQASPATNARLDINGTVALNITAVAALNMDLSAGTYFTKTVSAATAFTVSNIPASRYVSWLLKITNGGSATVTWPTGTKWNGGVAPTLTAAGVDIISFFTDDGGTTIYAFLVSKDSK